jgi:PUA domain protein
MAEGKQHAMGIGYTVMSTDEIRSVNKNVGVELIQYLNDGMWRLNLE